jgi:hypothetical protein
VLQSTSSSTALKLTSPARARYVLLLATPVVPAPPPGFWH